MPPTQPVQNLDQDAVRLAMAIRQKESGGSPNPPPGASGEHGLYQWMPDTWKQTTAKYGLDPLDMSRENENKAAYMTIKELKDQGVPPDKIAAYWNMGGKALTKGYAGNVSPPGQKPAFDTPQYVRDVQSIYEGMKGSPTVLGASQPQANAPLPAQEGLGQQLMGRVNQLTGAVTDAFTGKMRHPFVSGPLQAVGAVAGGVGDIVGAGLELIPGVKQAEGAIGQGVGKALATPTGQKILKGGQDWAAANPETSKDIGAVGNIVSNIPILKAPGMAVRAGVRAATSATRGAVNIAEKGLVGSTLQGMAERSLYSKAAKVLETTPTVGSIGSAVRGGRIAVDASMAPDPFKEASIREIMPLVKEGAVSPSTPARNAISIKKAADKTAEDMRTLIRSQDVQPILQPESLQGMADNVAKRAGETLASGENPAKTLMEQFYRHLPKGDILPEDVLNARQAVSEFILKNKGDWTMRGVMTGFKSARDAFWDESRTLLADMVPHLPVREMLKRQTSLYGALDYLPGQIKGEMKANARTYFQRHPWQKAGLVKGLELGGLGAVAGYVGQKN